MTAEELIKWQVGDKGVEIGKRATNANVFKVRDVKERLLMVSKNAEFADSPDAGDGYETDTHPMQKDQARKI